MKAAGDGSRRATRRPVAVPEADVGRERGPGQEGPLVAEPSPLALLDEPGQLLLDVLAGDELLGVDAPVRVVAAEGLHERRGRPRTRQPEHLVAKLGRGHGLGVVHGEVVGLPGPGGDGDPVDRLAEPARPSSVTVAPPGGMSESEMRAPPQARRPSCARRSTRRWTGARGRVVRGGSRPLEAHHVAASVYSSPVAGSMAMRRFGPSQCWKPRRSRCVLLAGPRREERSGWKVRRASGTAHPARTRPGARASRPRRGAWRRRAGAAPRRPGRGRAPGATGRAASRASTCVSESPRSPKVARSSSRRAWGPSRSRKSRRVSTVRAGLLAGQERRGRPGRRTSSPASRRRGAAGRGPAGRARRAPAAEDPLQVRRRARLGSLGAQELAGRVDRLDAGLVPARPPRARAGMRCRVGRFPEPRESRQDLRSSLGRRTASDGTPPRPGSGAALVAEPEGGVGEHRAEVDDAVLRLVGEVADAQRSRARRVGRHLQLDAGGAQRVAAHAATS